MGAKEYLAKVEAAAKAEAEVLKNDAVAVENKVVTFAKAHVPTIVGAVVGYVAGHFGLLALVLKHVL